MKNKEKIAANVVTYNRKDLLRECLNSLLAQTRKPDSIIIVDNNSNDGTKEMLKKEFLDNPIFDYVRLNENTGSAGGQYTGIKRAYEKGFDWVWCMDDDAIPQKDCLEKMLVSKRKNKKVDVLIPIKIDIYGKIQTKHFGNFSKKFLLIRNIKENNENVDFGSFVGPMFSRKVIEKVGFPNSNLFIWNDDYEYFLRIKMANFMCLLVKDAIILHKDDSGRQKKKKLNWKNYYGWRNGLYIKKNFCKKVWYLFYLLAFLPKTCFQIIFIYHQPKYLKILALSFIDALREKIIFRDPNLL
jgi:GT2 family glycosyltransferase